MARRSDAIWALDNMLRRSWLIFATASPSAASRAREVRAARRSACIRSSSASARPISSRRPDRATWAAGSAGSAPEPLQGHGDPLDRPHQEDVQGDEHAGSGHPGDENGHPHQPEQIADQLLPQRRVGDHHLDEVRRRAEARLCHHPHPALVAPEQGPERLSQPDRRVAAAQVHQLGRAPHARRLQQQPAHTPPLCTATETTPAPLSSWAAMLLDTVRAGAALHRQGTPARRGPGRGTSPPGTRPATGSAPGRPPARANRTVSSSRRADRPPGQIQRRPPLAGSAGAASVEASVMGCS